MNTAEEQVFEEEIQPVNMQEIRMAGEEEEEIDFSRIYDELNQIYEKRSRRG